MRYLTPICGAAILALSPLASAADITFDNGTSGWRVVLDGVMGGRSTGRIRQETPGTMSFTGTLSLENNGGFAQIRTSLDEGSCTGAEGIEVRVKGDGRTYSLDLRTSNVRLMAGAFQSDVETVAGEWRTIRVPFDSFTLYNFGQAVRNAPPLDSSLIDSVGFTLADYTPGPFAIEVDSIRAYSSGDSADQSNSLGSVANAAGLTTLLDLVAAAGLELPQGERVTILAPTNDAFAALPAEKVKFLTSSEGRSLLRTVLSHHITTTARSSANILDSRGLDMLSGQRITVSPGTLQVGGASLLAADVPFDRGVVHVIDSVLIPETRTVEQIVAEDPRLSTLAAALGAGGLTGQLGPRNDGPWTLFAPTNDAFAALPDGTLETLLQPDQRMALANILAYHVIPARIQQRELLSSGSLRPLNSASLDVGIVDGGLALNRSTRIVTADIQASNGVIHLIDSVLLPPAAMDESSDTVVAIPSILRVLEQTVELGAPLYNEGNPAACAAAYEIALRAVIELSGNELGPNLGRELRRAIAEGSEREPAERAWRLRNAIDLAYTELSRRNEQRLAKH